MFTESPSGKVRFVAMGELPPPGSCFVCGSGTRDEGYVDLGVWLEYIGEALICHTCVIEIGEKIKMMVPEEVQHIQRLAESLTEENTALKTELAASNERLNHYDSLARGLFTPGDFASIGVAPDGKPSDVEVVELPDAGEPEASESDSGERRLKRAGSPKSDNGSSARPSPIKL